MKIKYRFEYYLFIIIGKLLTPFGYRSINLSAKIIAFLFFYIIPIRKDVVIKNLTLAFPEKSSKERKRLAYKNYISIAKTFLEIFNLQKLNKSDIKKIFMIKNIDLLNNKIGEDNGLIILTAHFGNWELGAIATGIYLNDQINVLVKRQKNPYVAKWLNNFRESYGNKQIPLGVSVRDIYKSIKSKKIVGVVGDQRGKTDGIIVKFFNNNTFTFAGTAAITLKTNCPVVVMFCHRQKDGTYIGETAELNYSEFKGTDEEKIKQFNQRYMTLLERAIRKNPEQWLWMHNIWKDLKI